jgi:hypothetical protein
MLVTDMMVESSVTLSARLVKPSGVPKQKEQHAMKANILPDKKYDLNDFIMGMY